MTEVAAVTRHPTPRPGAAPGAQASGGDALEGAFAALFGTATGQLAFGIAPGQGKPGEMPSAVAGQSNLAELTGLLNGEEIAAALAAQAKDDTTGSAGDGDGLTRPGKTKTTTTEGEDALPDPAAMPVAAALAPTAETATPADTDTQARATTKSKTAQAIELASEGQPGDQVKAAATGKTAPVTEGAGEKRLVGPTPAKAQGSAVTSSPALAGQAGTDADTAERGNAGDTDAQPESRLAALLTAARKTGEEGPGSITTTDPFKAILQTLPPDVQNRIGVQDITAGQGVTRTASTGELLGNQVIDMSVEGQWIDRMAREIATLSEGTGHSRFQLMPPNLGRIQVDLWRGEGQTNVRLLTETDEAAQRLREGQGALESHARLASLSLGSVSVEKAPSGSGADANRDQNAQAQQRQQAEAGGDAQQQASAQDQAGRGRSGAVPSGSGRPIGMDTEQLEDAARTDPRAPRAADPRVRFA